MNHGLYSCASRLRNHVGAGLAPALLLLALCLFALPAARADTASALSTPDSLFAAGKFEPARVGYTAAVLAAPRDPAPHIGLVRTLLRLDHWTDAVTEARAAATQFPQNANLHGLYALALIRAGWQPPCVDEAKQSLTLDASDYWGLVASGRLADWDDKEEEARTDFRKATAAQPALPDAWLGLLNTLDDEKDVAEKESAAKAYLNLAPTGHPHDEEAADLREYLIHADAYKKAFGADPPFRRQSDTAAPGAVVAGKATTIKVEFVGDYAVFPVLINDQKFRLLFDTGADRVTLAKNPARRLKLAPLAHTYIRGVSGSEPSDTLRADTMTVSDLTYRSIVIDTMRDTPAGTDGLFGGTILEDSVVTLDYVNGTATLTHGSEAAAPPPLPGDAVVAVPFRNYHHDLLAHMALNTVPVWALLDTGAEDTLLSLRLARQQLSAVPKDDSRTGTVKGRIGVGGDTRMDYIYSEDESDITLSQSPLITIPTKTIGASLMDRYISPGTDFEIGILFGVSTLTSARRVTFDYPHHLMTFEYVIPPPEPTPAEKPEKKPKK